MIRAPAWLRAILLAAVLIALAVAIVYRHQVHPQWLAEIVDDFPAATPVAFVVVHVAASLLFVPRNLMAMVAGGLFGGVWGGVVSVNTFRDPHASENPMSEALELARATEEEKQSHL